MGGDQLGAATRSTGGRGALVAAALAGSWRQLPPPLRLSSAELADLTPCLLRTGAAALAWWRLRQADLTTTPLASSLEGAFRLYALASLRHEGHVRKVVTWLRSAGIDPILVKGWAIARLYPERGLRPYVDVDLCVRPDLLPRAMAVLHEHACDHGSVDLHAEVADLEDRTWEAVLARSRVLRLGTLEVRILGAEDELRHLGLHLIRHGGWRPLWLCDVGVALESLPSGFDWDYCLHGAPWRSEWLVCTLGLACRLLGARGEAAAWTQRLGDLPRWLVAALVREWGSLLPGDSHSRDDRPLASYWRRPGKCLHALRCRWPNPMEATFAMQASPFTRWPGLWFQVRSCIRRGLRLPGKIRRTRRGRGQPFAVHVSG